MKKNSKMGDFNNLLTRQEYLVVKVMYMKSFGNLSI